MNCDEYNIKTLLLQFSKNHIFLFITYFILALSFPIREVLLPHYYGEIIDKLSKQKIITKLIKIIIGLWIIVQLSSMLMDRLDAIFIPKLQSYIRENIVIKIIKSYQTNFKELPTPELISKIIKLPLIIRDLSHQIRNFMLPTFMIIVSTLIHFSFIDMKLMLIMLFGTLTFVFLFYMFSQNCMFHSEYMDTSHNKLHEEIGDILNNLQCVYSSDTLPNELNNIRKCQHQYDEKYRDTILCASNFKIMFNLVIFLFFMIINYYAYSLYTSKKISLQKLITIFIIILYTINNLYGVDEEIRDFVFNLGNLQQSQKFIDTLTCPPKQPLPKNNIKKGHIKYKNVNVHFKQNQTPKHILRNINLEIPYNQKVGIIGDIGSGKSTLAKTLLHFNDYTGNIFIDDILINNKDPNYLRKQILYVPQHPKLFNRTLYENISYGTNASKEDVKNLISKLGIKRNIPEIDRNVGKNGDNLSGGQKRMVIILRCFLKPGNVLILDEPLVSLDKQTKNVIINMLEKLMKNKTTILITHQQDMLNHMDRIIELSKGQIISDRN